MTDDFLSRKRVEGEVRQALTSFWQARDRQGEAQGSDSGLKDTGNRSKVTAGKHLDGLGNLIEQVILSAGIEPECLHRNSKAVLPGFFRPDKQWDLIVVRRNRLLAAIELKSQVGSFGNNFNNRTEEALGSAIDLQTACRELVLPNTTAPWVGLIFVLEDSAKSQSAVRDKAPHFPTRQDFHQTSYAQRYQILLRSLLAERLYQGACLLLTASPQSKGALLTEPCTDLGPTAFLTDLYFALRAEIQKQAGEE